MDVVSNEYLQSAFKGMNRAYFGNRLDPNILVSFKRMKYLGQTRKVWFQRPVTKKEIREERVSKNAIACYYIPRIYISESFRYARRLCIGTLLHEMVHAEMFEKGIGHRKGMCNSGQWNKFNKRMLQLAKAGAFNGWW